MPKIVAIDIETSCNGTAEYRFWRKGFKIDSIAASWREDSGELRSWYSDTPRGIDSFIRGLAERQTPLVVHNLGFELGVFLKLYPSLSFNWAADTLRLAQLLDNGGDWRDFQFKTADDLMDEILDEVAEVKTGLSLEAVASRFLPADRHNHKSEAHDWLEQNHKIKSGHGSYLHLLPPDILRRYNIADTEVTLMLYEELYQQLELAGMDWSQDWILYTTRCKAMQEAYIRGIKIDREALRQEIYKVDAEIRAITTEFFEKTAEAREEWARRTQERKKAQRKRPEEFNIGSNTQLKQLFLSVLGVCSGKITKTGEEKVEKKELTLSEASQQYPSFASKHLKLYGPLGEILLKRRKRLLVLQQMLATYASSEEDGRTHPEQRVSGTKTNRVSGGIAE